MKSEESLFDHVGAFHAKFNLPVAGRDRPATLLSEELLEYRLGFLHEELAEFAKSHAEGDLVAAADALADLVWVALGTAHFIGLPFDEVWRSVRHANMAKVRVTSGDASHKRGAVEVIRKPDGWVPPEDGIRETIDRWNTVADVRHGRHHR